MRAWSKAVIAAAALGLLGGSAMAQVLGDAAAHPPAHGEGHEDYTPALKPSVAGNPFAVGIAAMKTKHYHEAATAFEAITDGAPQDPRGWSLLGAAYAGELNWKASKKAYERAVKLAPDDIAAHAGLGLALQALKDPGLQAQSDWLKAKAQACAGACPDAAKLKALESTGLLPAG